MASTKTLLTAEDLLRLPEDECRYELLDGELVTMAPTGAEHGRIAARVAYRLLMHVEAHNGGAVLTNDPGIILRRNPDRVRAPDVCFIARERIPAGGLPQGYLETVPDLIVEVVSPNDTAVDVQQKVEEWLQAGARLVWVVYPGTRSVVVYQSLTQVRVYKEGDTLDGAPVWSDFACPVASLFA
ncbi:MAG: Uma2 family endonuclease [Chloroflexi bacterium]|nr:Uma2 family endonuclease [Chloroflexota bacterium]